MSSIHFNYFIIIARAKYNDTVFGIVNIFWDTFDILRHFKIM